jgi:hypothetical protein
MYTDKNESVDCLSTSWCLNREASPGFFEVPKNFRKGKDRKAVEFATSAKSLRSELKKEPTAYHTKKLWQERLARETAKKAQGAQSKQPAAPPQAHGADSKQATAPPQAHGADSKQATAPPQAHGADSKQATAPPKAQAVGGKSSAAPKGKAAPAIQLR